MASVVHTLHHALRSVEYVVSTFSMWVINKPFVKKKKKTQNKVYVYDFYNILPTSVYKEHLVN